MGQIQLAANTVIYGGGDNGLCEPSAVTPPCKRIEGCEYVQITVKIGNIVGPIEGEQLVNIDGGLIYVDYKDTGEGSRSKEWTIGHPWDDPTVKICSWKDLLISINGVEIMLVCTECDEF